MVDIRDNAAWPGSCDKGVTMRKLGFVVLGILAAAGGCSTEDETAEPVPTVGVSKQQLDAFDALRVSSQKDWRWIQHEDLKTPLHLSTSRVGAATLLPQDDIELRTLEVLETNKALFNMREPGLELTTARTEVDRYGIRHARFQQVSHGVPVAGAQLTAHYDAEGRLASIDANYIADLDSIDVNPRLTSDEALALVKADVLARTPIDAALLHPNEGKLVIYAKASRLAYEYEVRALAGTEPAIWIITVDAQTGDILHRYNNLQTIEGSGVGILGDTKEILVSSSGNGYVLEDSSTGLTYQTFTAGQQQLTNAQFPGTLVKSTSATSWDTGTTGRGAAVDAHFNAGIVGKYYKTVHNRNSIDGAGGPLQSTVHFGVQYDNAAWAGTGMMYGDGGKVFKPLPLSVDVVGHEFTHGVTAATSQLAYENQSGALNEAVSDIFGAFIEHSVTPDAVKNWQMGEVVTKDGKPLRDMSNPNAVEVQQPAHMNQFFQTSQDEGGVHINSGIINNAAYLMTVGGTNPVSKITVKNGIGWEKSEQLWYQANTKYFMASTNFAQAAQGVAQAGKDIGLTTEELAIVDCAFKATGVLDGACAKSASTNSGTDTSDDSASTTDDDEPKTSTKKKKKKTYTTEESGCNATGNAELGALLPFLAALGVIGVKRRRRS